MLKIFLIFNWIEEPWWLPYYSEIKPTVNFNFSYLNWFFSLPWLKFYIILSFLFLFVDLLLFLAFIFTFLEAIKFRPKFTPTLDFFKVLKNDKSIILSLDSLLVKWNLIKEKLNSSEDLSHAQILDDLNNLLFEILNLFKIKGESLEEKIKNLTIFKLKSLKNLRYAYRKSKKFLKNQNDLKKETIKIIFESYENFLKEIEVLEENF